MRTAEVLKELIELFNKSTIAYRQYLAAGKTFQFALELKLYNGKALQLLIDNKQSMPEDLQEDIQSLITHYREWSQKWEQLAAEKQHEAQDVFVFANDITFPRQAAQNLEAAYQQL
ncbi:MAG: hypothetical protein SGI83_06865 [Bacteroidota bacterium]|nr:hypothetical protein [Bacteroidota bacterium]